MNQEDEEFNRIERESKLRMEAVYQEVQKRNKAMDREYVRPWVGLTDDEIYSVLENLQVMHHRPPTTDSRVIFAQAIEQALKEKNT